MWEMMDRMNEDKSCPTDGEYLFHDPYAGAVEYSPIELYHRATFTLTGQYPSAGEYLSLLEHGDFDENDFVGTLQKAGRRPACIWERAWQRQRFGRGR